MSVLNRTKNTLPAIPKVTVNDPLLQRFCDAVTQFCAIHAGRVGSGLDRAMTIREMLNSGFAVKKSTSTSTPTGGGLTDIVPPPESIIVDKPTPPTGFRVLSGTTAILLIWDDVNFKGAASTMIYRASLDDFSQAVVIATTPAAVYSDITDSSDPYWYWIRHTNVDGDMGALNDASGTMGQAGLLTTNPDGDTMLASELVAFAIYATELTAVHITGGDMDFAGGRFTVDVNGNCTASSLTINTGGYGRSADYAAGVSGWAIYGNGDCEFNHGTFRGTVYAEDGEFKGTVYADHIVGDLVSGTMFAVTQGVIYSTNVWTTVGTFTVTNNNTDAATLMVQSITFDCSGMADGGAGGWDGEIRWYARLVADGVSLAMTSGSSGVFHLSDGQESTRTGTLQSPTYFETLAVGESHTYELQVMGQSVTAITTGCGAALFRDGAAFS